jgi:hypothetical protein
VLAVKADKAGESESIILRAEPEEARFFAAAQDDKRAAYDDKRVAQDDTLEM